MNLNVDIGQILRSLLQKRKAGGISQPLASTPYKEAIIYTLLIVTLFTLCVSLLQAPRYKETIEKRKKLEQLYSMQQNFEGITQQIADLKQKMIQQKQHYHDILEYFSNSKDLGKLYQSVATLSSLYNITVVSMKESEATPLSQYEMIGAILVDVELRGNYNAYMKFKEDLYKNEPLLRIQKESMQVGQDASNPGLIFVKLQFSTYAIDKKPFLEAIASYE